MPMQMQLKQLKINTRLAYILFLIAVLGMAAGAAVYADTITSSVTVGNSAPSFTVNPAESVASSTANPTNEGGTVTIQATATDSNAEDYYLIICDTNSVSATNGSAPTCTSTAYCTSTATTSGSQASCDIDTTGNATENNAWYAFVCDGNASAASCSSSSQGSGNSGSPFVVNHRPVFDAISNNGPQDPGDDITYSTNVSTDDSDSFGGDDTVTLVVCKTAGVTGTACDGGGSDTWCTSTAVTSNPSCTFTLDNPLADQAYDGYAYLFDNHGFAANDTAQGSNDQFTVSNVVPVVSSVVTNSGSDITLVESTTVNVDITATVTDDNSCQDISSVLVDFYRSGLTATGCNANGEDDNNDCYARVSCSIDTGSNDCTGSTDAAAAYSCTIGLQYHADATATGAPTYAAENWISTVTGSDEALSGTGDASGVEVDSLLAYDVTASINYGSLSAGESNDPLDRITDFEATGNVPLDAEASGTNLTSGSDSIVVTQQRYALAASTAYTSGTQLTGVAASLALNIPKTTVTASPETAPVYWGIEIPSGTVAGSYSGTNTLVAVLDT